MEEKPERVTHSMKNPGSEAVGIWGSVNDRTGNRSVEDVLAQSIAQFIR